MAAGLAKEPMKFAFIEEHRGRVPIRFTCTQLAVVISGYYARRKRSPSMRILQNKRLKVQIKVCHEASGAKIW